MIQKYKLLIIFIWLSVVTISCEKDFNYNRPADANTMERDMEKTFHVLSEADKKWLWPLQIASAPFDNSGLGLIMEFKKDSTASAQIIASKTIIEQFKTLVSTGKLQGFPAAVANVYINSLAGYADWNLKNLLNLSGNAPLKLNIKEVLPNYENFNPIVFLKAEDRFDYNINGSVQLNLTFTNTLVFPQLKQGKSLDYDFRIISYNNEVMALKGYYRNSENKESKLYKITDNKDIDLFANGSNIFVPEANILAGATFIRVNGNNITLPVAINSGLDFFYRRFKQLFIKENKSYGFSRLGEANDLPAELLASKSFIVKSVYTGNITTAPSGTVLVTLTGLDVNGNQDGKTVEFVKN